MIALKPLFESKSITNFVIQEHFAARAGRHFDLRIEYDNTLKSWATRKLEDLIEDRKKRIQIFPTEDHDMKWLKYQGRIGKGYGEGEVKIWDTGKCEILKWTSKIKVIVFNGKKIRGKYTILQFKPKNFLMFPNKI